MMRINVDFLRIYPASGYRTQFHKRWQSQIDANRSIADAIRNRPEAAPPKVEVKISNVVDVKRSLIHIDHKSHVADANKIFVETEVGALFVSQTVKGKMEYVGMLTRTDVVNAAARGKLDARVQDVMTAAPNLHTVSLDQELKAALHYALDIGHHRLPIVDGQKQIVGIVTLKELASAWTRREGR